MKKGIVLLLAFILVGSFFTLFPESSSSLEVVENSWSTKEPLPQTGGSRAAVVNGKIYAISGSVHYVYDLATDDWTSVLPKQLVAAQLEGFPYESPTITVLSPLPNGTITVHDITLNVTVQLFGFLFHNIEKINSLNYSLDGQIPVPMKLTIPSDLKPGYYVRGDGILTGVSDGTHILTFYGETRISGIIKNFNTTVSFRVDTTSTLIQEPFPIGQVIAILVTIAVVTVVVLLYFKKRNRMRISLQ